MKTILVAVLAVFSMAACGGADATCNRCGVSFSDTECNTIGTSRGCSRGESVVDTLCTQPTRGCRFFGCPTGVAVMCDLPSDASTNTDASGG